MRGKAALIIGLGTGYVLGTRDGHERYEQIKAQATRLWHDPRVQEKATQAKDLAAEKGPEVQRTVTDAAHQAAGKVTDKVGSKTDSKTDAKTGTTTGGTTTATPRPTPQAVAADPAAPVVAEPTPATDPATGHA